MTQAATAVAAFRDLHGAPPAGVWAAPGRVNLIGEHTDYNDGFVLPFALPHRIAAAAGRRDDGMLTVATVGSDGKLQRITPVAIADLEPGGVSGWGAYPAGVAWALRDEGVSGGADLVLAGDVPTGAGLSSSAALECAVALALLGLAGYGEPDAARRVEIARLAQRAENDFVGAPTGVLDQTASMCCVEGNVLFLDVRSGESEQVPFDTAEDDLRILVIDTRAKHSHSESGYGERRRGTERAADLLGVKSLREITPEGLDAAMATLPAELGPLVRHVVTENQRVLDVVASLRAGRVADIGPSLNASHASLRDDYRVSAVELDLAVEAALEAGALGARMTGGGFGGSAIALIRSGDQQAVESAVGSRYVREHLPAPRFFLAVPAAGAGRV
ncbi:galactokinase [Amycolatopsis antarctica]|uniref:Galactokinase n=1 Tax=Amycolatopsis antarctica TaxID=1854586 RepID=A0A263D7T1_9PSEU|nr:galactokinase [Amycolatopsis antarctica]OZM74493.1 galactokinase [Amycolatopsis antarctica]